MPTHDCPDCGATKEETMVLGFACQHGRCPILSQIPAHISDYANEGTKVCRSCGCDETDHRGLLTCECPAIANPTV